jgi:oligoendopeptidase F
MKTPVFDANATGGKDLGPLPDWDLTDLYAAPDAPEFKRDMDWLEDACARFAADYEGKLATLDRRRLLDCILRYEKIDTVAGRLMSYAGLRYYQNTTDPERAKFIADAQDRITAFTTPLVFFSLEVNRIEDADLAQRLAENADLARYKPVFDRLRAMKPYQLSDELEKFLHDQSTVGAAAWNRLFDETIAASPSPWTARTCRSNPPSTCSPTTTAPAARRAPGRWPGLREEPPLFARVHNTLAKEKEIEDRWRGMPTPQTGRHLSNQVEPEVVEALRNAVVAAYPKLSHRYYELKRKWLGLDTLQVWDRNAPLPMESNRLVGWDDARATVMDAYAEFDPRMADLAAPSSTRAGSTRASSPARPPAPSPIPPSPTCTPTSCSTTSANRAT